MFSSVFFTNMSSSCFSLFSVVFLLFPHFFPFFFMFFFHPFSFFPGFFRFFSCINNKRLPQAESGLHSCLGVLFSNVCLFEQEPFCISAFLLCHIDRSRLASSRRLAGLADHLAWGIPPSHPVNTHPSYPFLAESTRPASTGTQPTHGGNKSHGPFESWYI